MGRTFCYFMASARLADVERVLFRQSDSAVLRRSEENAIPSECYDYFDHTILGEYANQCYGQELLPLLMMSSGVAVFVSKKLNCTVCVHTWDTGGYFQELLLVKQGRVVRHIQYSGGEDCVDIGERLADDEEELLASEAYDLYKSLGFDYYGWCECNQPLVLYEVDDSLSDSLDSFVGPLVASGSTESDRIPYQPEH